MGQDIVPIGTAADGLFPWEIGVYSLRMYIFFFYYVYR
jgi:hypothetical protein